MVKRKLSEEELKIVNKVLIGRQDELDWNEYQVEFYEMMLAKGLEVNYKKTVRDYGAKLGEFKGELLMTKNIIKELEEQIKNGVDVKDESSEKEVD